MLFQEFTHTVLDYVAEQFGDDYSVTLQKIQKNNGIQYEGLMILHPGNNMSPLIYLNPYYHRYLNGMSVADICGDVCRIYRSNMPACSPDVSFFFDYGKVRPHLIPKLINYERNRKLLEHTPHKRILDLAVVFLCLMDDSFTEPDGCRDAASGKKGSEYDTYASVLVNDRHTDYWHVTTQELYDAALQNGPKLMPSRLNSMQELLAEFSRKYHSEHFTDGVNLKEEEDALMYVLTNCRRINGASAMLYEGELARVAARFHKNLVVLPSSVHEVILVPVEEETPQGLDYFCDMVREVNETQVADDEILSDRAYFYERQSGKLSLF